MIGGTDFAFHNQAEVTSSAPLEHGAAMSIFGAIKDAIFGKAKAAPPPATPAPRPGQPPVQAAPASTAVVDVDATLADVASKKGQRLNYKESIVDLMKVLDLDSSLTNRKELAKELGYSGATDGSAEMNMWLHREVMKKLAANGGKVSAELRG